MTAFDVLNLYQTPFEWMLNSGIHIEDVSYVGLYKEYIRMKKGWLQNDLHRRLSGRKIPDQRTQGIYFAQAAITKLRAA